MQAAVVEAFEITEIANDVYQEILSIESGVCFMTSGNFFELTPAMSPYGS